MRLSKTAKILNIAWVGQGDFGDEAMAYALRMFLKKIGVESITYYQQGRSSVFKGNSDLTISSLHRHRTKELIKKMADVFLLRRFNILLIGGGSIFHSINSIKWKFDILKKMRKFNKTSFLSVLVGVSFGPFKSLSAEEFCLNFLGNADIIIARDRRSYDWAKEAGSNEQIYSSLDTSLLLPEICTQEMSRAADVKKEEDLVGIMFIKKNRAFNDDLYFEKYLAILNRILEKNKKVILFVIHVGDAVLDKELSEALRTKCKFPEKIQIHFFDGDIFKTIRELNRCSFIVSMRLHGIIFAYMLGIPFMSLGYDPKNKNFCDSINYPSIMSFDLNWPQNFELVLTSIDLLFEKGRELMNNSLPVKKASEMVFDNMNLLAKEIKEVL